MKSGIILIFYSLLVLSGISSACANDITVKLSQRIVRVNESFTVTFVANEQVKEQPNFSALKEDFNLISTNRMYRTTNINGRSSQEIYWNLVLMPKQEGKLTIPAVKFDSSYSEPVTIEVEKAALPGQQKDEELFLETDLQPNDSAYEQSLLIYTIRLYRTVQLAQAVLSELKTNDSDTLIAQVGKDLEYSREHNGKQYAVFERKYAVSPQHAGELKFSPILFQGTVLNGGRSFFDVQTKIKSLASDEKKVDIKPIPPSFQKDHWLPANDVTVSEEWSADINKMILGEPITWTLTLSANGCLGSQIPEIALNFPSDLKHYLDKPEVVDHPNADGIVGVKQMKVVLIPTKLGEVRLPELVINWWDLTTDQARQTRLPARTIQVLGNSGEIAMNPPLNASTVVEAETKEIEDPGLPFWAYYLIGLNLIVLIGLSAAVYTKICLKETAPKSLKQIKRHLKKACHANDAKTVEFLLQTWAGHLHPENKPRNILEMKQDLPEDLQKAIDELYQFLYGQRKSWDGLSLWSAFSAFKYSKAANRRADKDQAEQSPLRNLY